MDTVNELLIAGRALITGPGKLARGMFAQTAAGNGCFSNDPKAVGWCSVGALHKAATDAGVPEPRMGTLRVEAEKVLNTAARARSDGRCNIMQYNDRFPQRAVLRVWDDAIKATC